MADWEKLIKTITYDWLLGEENQSVRFFTLGNLLGRPESDRQIIQARAEIMQKDAFPKILAKQHADGYWGKPENYYIYAKYKDTAHTMSVLAQLGVNPSDARTQNRFSFILG